MRETARIIGRCGVAVACLLLLLLTTTVAEACPNCKEALAGDPDRANMVRGYYWSILFMMSMPFTIFTLLSTYFYLLYRRGRQAGWGDDVRAMIAASEQS